MFRFIKGIGAGASDNSENKTSSIKQTILISFVIRTYIYWPKQSQISATLSLTCFALI